MNAPELPILEYRGSVSPDDAVIPDESADAREVFTWLFVSLAAVPLAFGLVFAIGNVLR